MNAFHRSDLAAIALGVMTYLGIAGWLNLAPIPILIVNAVLGGGPLDMTGGTYAGVRQIVAAVVFAVAGYVAGRTSEQSRLRNAALVGVMLYVLVTLFNRMLYSLLGADGMDASAQTLEEAGALLRAVFASFVGGTAAQWHLRQRGVRRFDVAASPRGVRGAEHAEFVVRDPRAHVAAQLLAHGAAGQRDSVEAPLLSVALARDLAELEVVARAVDAGPVACVIT